MTPTDPQSLFETELNYIRRAAKAGDLHTAVTRLNSLLAYLHDNVAMIPNAVGLADQCLGVIDECSLLVDEKKTESSSNRLIPRWDEELALSRMYAAWAYQSNSLLAKSRVLLSVAVNSGALPEDALTFALYNLGICSGETEHEETAATAFARVLSMNEDDLDARYNLGMSLARLGRASEAVKVFEEFLKRDRSSEDAVRVRAALERLRVEALKG